MTTDLFPTRSQIRGLSLWRPWPQAMHGVLRAQIRATPTELMTTRYQFTPGPKGIENRGWHPPAALEGACWLALQSAQTFDEDGQRFLAENGWEFAGPYPKDCITGVGFLAGSFGGCDRGCDRCRSPNASEHRSDPYYMGRVGWLITGRVPLIEPVPCKGRQGIFRLPPDVETQVRAEYARTVSILGDLLPPGPRMTP